MFEHERQLEKALMSELQRFMLELGRGFAFYSRQQTLIVGEREFRPDLIFYHHWERRFLVIDLKIGRFEPEYAGKMGLYLSAVDKLVCHPDDKPSVGLILCTSKDDAVVDHSFARTQSPIYVSRWTYRHGDLHALPAANISADVPSETEAELEKVGLPELGQQLQERVDRRFAELE